MLRLLILKIRYVLRYVHNQLNILELVGNDILDYCWKYEYYKESANNIIIIDSQINIVICLICL